MGLTPGGALPEPDDPDLQAHLGKRASIYAVLYEHKDRHGLTYDEIQALIPGYRGRVQFQRRVRSLRQYFVIEKTQDGQSVRHHLKSVREHFADQGDITGKLRAKVLEKGRCFRCGKNPEEDGVKLAVDHRIPREWGGPTEEWNLQPLCTICNSEKKDRLSEYDAFRPQIAQAIQHDEVQRRIGELLIGFGGQPVPADLVQLVASKGQFRNDWERRFRDLRTLGWEVKVRRLYRDGKPVDAEYWVVEPQPWPDEPISPLLERIRLAKKAKRTKPDA